MTRIPPHDLDAESAVISAVMLDATAFDSVSDRLAPEHCYSRANQLICEAIWALVQTGSPVDLVKVAGYLRDKQLFRQAGGSEYLAQVVDATPAVANVAEHAKRIRELWRLRQFISLCRHGEAEAFDAGSDVQGFLDEEERKLFELASAANSRELISARELSRQTLEQLYACQQGRALGISTGFAEVDYRTTGMHSGDLWIIAGRPGMGKSALALSVGQRVSSSGHGIVLFSLEMPKLQMGARLFAVESRVNVKQFRTGRLTDNQWATVTNVANEVAQLPFFLDDTPALTLLEMRAKVRRAQSMLRREGRKLGLVIVDYLQLMQGPKSAGNREQEISELSRGLKALAKEADCTVMALSQLNRAVEQRPDKRPKLSDLRESGAIEQDADLVAFVYRDEYYSGEQCKEPGVAEVIIAKQRNGPTGTVRLRFTDSCTRFDNLEPEPLDGYGTSCYDVDDDGFQRSL